MGHTVPATRDSKMEIPLKTFAMGVVLNRRLAPGSLKRFEFAEQEPQQPFAVEPGLEQFLKDRSLSGDSEGAEVQRKSNLPQSIITGAIKPEGSASFPVCSATRRIRLIRSDAGPLGSKGMPV